MLRDFSDYGRTIIAELGLPVALKTIKPKQDMGGLAVRFVCSLAFFVLSLGFFCHNVAMS